MNRQLLDRGPRFADNLAIVNIHGGFIMPTVTLAKHLNAAPEAVFALATDLANAPGRVKAITKLELLTPGPIGVGTRFRETRVMFGKEATEEMTISAFDPPHGYEVTAHSCGTDYHTIFRFLPESGGTRVEFEFHARAVSFFAKLLTPLMFLMKGVMRKCVEQDLEDIKKAAEAVAAGT
jgi:hypothetical protein